MNIVVQTRQATLDGGGDNGRDIFKSERSRRKEAAAVRRTE
jgi:hypothetical protein